MDGGEKMLEFSPDLQAKAIELAKELSGDDVIALPVGDRPEALWISLNPNTLIPLYHIDEEDRTIHIGLRKKETADSRA